MDTQNTAEAMPTTIAKHRVRVSIQGTDGRERGVDVVIFDVKNLTTEDTEALLVDVLANGIRRTFYFNKNQLNESQTLITPPHLLTRIMVTPPLPDRWNNA